MLKIQVLELPSVHIGENYETPFVLVISGVTAELEADFRDPGVVAGIKAATGARGILTFSEDIEVG